MLAYSNGQGVESRDRYVDEIMKTLELGLVSEKFS